MSWYVSFRSGNGRVLVISGVSDLFGMRVVCSAGLRVFAPPLTSKIENTR